MDAPPQSCDDDSYWTPPSPLSAAESEVPRSQVFMCMKCLDDCSIKYYREKLCGKENGPKYVENWNEGDPRFNDVRNPLYNASSLHDSDWRDDLCPEGYKNFVHYVRLKYGHRCPDCLSTNEEVQPSPIENKVEPPVEKKKKRKKKKKPLVQENIEASSTNTPFEKPKLHVDSTSIPGKIIIVDQSKDKKESPGKHGKQKVDCNMHDIVGGFNVIKKEDERTGAMEIIINLSGIRVSTSN